MGRLLGGTNTTHVLIKGKLVAALLDTGSNVSTISENYYDKVLSNHTPLLSLNELINIEVANGAKLPYKGYIELTVGIPSTQSSVDVPVLVVPDTSFKADIPVLLGTNALCPLMTKLRHNLGNNFRQEVKLNGSWNLAFSSLGFDNRRLRRAGGRLAFVKSTSDFTIEGNSTITISCKLTKKIHYRPCTAVVERDENSAVTENLEVAPTLVDYEFNTATVQVTLSNLTNRNVHISQGSRLAVLQFCEISSDIPDGISYSHTNASDKATDQYLLLDKFDFSKCALSGESMRSLHDMLLKYQSAFSMSDIDVGFTNMVKHQINLNEGKPFKQRHRKLPPSTYKEVTAHLKQLLDANIIRQSSSPWCSNIVVVRKRDNSIRLCIDYRQLNNQTIKDAYALPRVDEVLDGLAGNVFFSVLDMKSGYHQIAVEESHKERTAFTVGPLGLFEFNRLPMGLSGSPATYQRMIEKCLHDLNHDICYVYLDDIIIMSQTEEEHYDRLGRVLDRLSQCNMKLSPKKCFFFQKEVKYVGHVISADGVRTDPNKTEKVASWPRPSNRNQLRSFLGFCGFFRRFIDNYATIVKPMNDLLVGSPTKKVRGKQVRHREPPYQWGPSQELAFEEIKQKLISPPVLGYPDFEKPFKLSIDASANGLGAVLYQEQGGADKVIAYASRGLSKTEKHYDAHKLEYLALKWAVTQKFHDYLYGNFFSVYTDNNPLTYVLTSAKLDATGHRWLAALATYDFEIFYKRGKDNSDADGLSRLSDDQHDKISQEAVKAIGGTVNGYIHSLVMTSDDEVSDVFHSELHDPAVWRSRQREDQVIYQLIRSLTESTDFRPQTTEGELLKREYRNLKLVRGVLYRKRLVEGTTNMQLVLPKEFRKTALHGCHDDNGHLGRDKCLPLLRDRFYWPKMQNDLEVHISSCERCVKRKHTPDIAPLISIKTSQPLELVCMDFLSLESSKGGFQHILVITDHFTRYAVAVPTKNMLSRTVAQVFLDQFVVHYGFPARIHSDQGANFVSKMIEDLCKLSGMEKSRTSPYHAMGNGACERFNRTLLGMLGTLKPSDKANWKNHVAPLVHAYNCCRHETTNISPYQLMFGRQPRLAIDVVLGLVSQGKTLEYVDYVEELKCSLDRAYGLANERIQKNQERQKCSYDARARGAVVQIGDRVLCKYLAFKGRQKLANRWEEEPYTVIEQPNPEIPVYVIAKETNLSVTRTLHRNNLLPIGSLPIEESITLPIDSNVDSFHDPLVHSPVSILNDDIEENDNAVIGSVIEQPTPAIPVYDIELPIAESIKLPKVSNVDSFQDSLVQSHVSILNDDIEENDNAVIGSVIKQPNPDVPVNDIELPILNDDIVENDNAVIGSNTKSSRPVPAPRRSKRQTQPPDRYTINSITPVDNSTSHIHSKIEFLNKMANEGFFHKVPAGINQTVIEYILQS